MRYTGGIHPKLKNRCGSCFDGAPCQVLGEGYRYQDLHGVGVSVVNALSQYGSGSKTGW